MARILPETPIGAITPEAARVHRLLKRLPDDAYTVWQRLAIWAEPGPDFWVLRSDGRGLLLKVVGITARDLEAAQHTSLLDMLETGTADSAGAALLQAGDAGAGLPACSDLMGAPFGRAAVEALRTFAQGVLAAAGAGELAEAALPGVILSPNISGLELQQAGGCAGAEAGIAWAGQEVMAPERFASWLEVHLGPVLSETALAHVRRAFTPEVVVPPYMTVCRPAGRNTGAQLTGYLLDYDQEHALKLDLAPAAENQAAARDLGVRLINGVAGSGKSLILIYRAHLLRRFWPQARILALTHNRALARDLTERSTRLSGGDLGVAWQTFMSWCASLWPVPWQEPIGQRARVAIFEEVAARHLAGTPVTAHMLQDEVDWFKDRQLQGREAYLAADRSGRGFALTEVLRRRVYDAMLAYHQELNRRGGLDWGDVPRRLLRYIEGGEVVLERYDFILIDEAQFFAPIWFEVVKRALKPGGGQLFMAADPKQGFLRRGQSWQASGLDVRGRSLQLARSYRTTREILDFATLLYRSKAPIDEEDMVAPSLLDMTNGPPPVLVPVSSPQDEITRVVNEIRRLWQARFRPEHILIIHATWQGAERVLVRLRKEFGPQAAADARNAPAGKHMRVCPLGAASGLESPVVFLMGTHELYEAEQSLRLSDQEREELIRDNTRKLYMAITRAGQRLVLTYVGRLPDDLARLQMPPSQPAHN